MTTAYTSLLGLALPVTGELSGTWGDTVNTAITSLLDTAIAGTTSITTDADITLSTTTGASNQARQAIILWNPASGTTTRNITAPAQSKMYTVINASGGTQSIVIRGAGPTTGVTVLKGESALVAWNGSDFVKVSSSGGAITFTDLTVTGNTILGDAAADTLTVNATSTFNAPVSFANLVRLPSTGRSAAAALTVTAPAFLYGVASTYTDTTSSGTIAAMAPFYSIAQPTLSTSNVTTYTTAATLYIANAPAAGGSATITNPWATYVAAGANYFGGTVSILTTTNSDPLTVNGLVRFIDGADARKGSIRFSSGGFNVQSDATELNLVAPSSYVAIFTGAAGTAFERVRVGATGQVGVGLTPLGNNYLIQSNSGISAGTSIVAQGSLQGYTGAGLFMSYESTYGRLEAYDYATTTYKNIAIAPNGGSVGVATSIPSASLHVVGTGSLFAGTPPALSATDPTYSGLAIGFNGVDNAAQLISTNPSSAAMAFFTKSGAGSAPAQRMVITAAGLVGVGTTSPLTALQVNSGSLYVLGVKSTTTYGFISLQDGGTSGTLTDGTVAVGANVDDLVFRSGGANRARLGGTGNFGLGATATAWLWPDSSTGVLQLQAGAAFSGYNAGAVVSQNWYYNAGEKFIGNGYASRYSQASGIHAWSVSTASNSSGAGAALTWSESMRITTAGKVAIGSTTSPQGRLSVWGSAASAIELSFDTTATYGDIQTYSSSPLFIQRQGNDIVLNNGGGGTIIGASSTRSGLLTLKNANPATTLIAIQNYGSTGTIGTVSFDQTTDVWLFANQTTNGIIAFGAGTSGTERMRITPTILYIGKTAESTTTLGWGLGTSGTGGTNFTVTSNEFFTWNNVSGGGSVQMDFRWNNTEVGSIAYTSSAVSFNTTSDYRLKDNPQPLTGSGAFIDALKPKTWGWKIDGSRGVGFLAHELQEVGSSSVHGEKDAMREDGVTPKYQSVEYGSPEFIANIVLELQSLRKRLADAGIA